MGIVRPIKTKKEVVKVEEVVTGVQIDLTLDEAKQLKRLLGNLGGDYDCMPIYLTNKVQLKGICEFTDRLYWALNEVEGIDAGFGTVHPEPASCKR